MNIFKKIASDFLNTKAVDEGAELPEIKSAEEQPEDEKKIVAFVKSKVESARQTNSRIAIEGIYLTNIAYLMGFDGIYYDTSNRQFRNVDPRRRITRSRFRVNKILPQIQNRLSRLTQSAPKYDVRPNSTSSEDKDACRLGLHVLNDIFDKQRFEEKRQDLWMSTMQGGHAYAQVTWDPTLGAPMIDPEDGKLVGYEGDVRIEILNCLEVFPDPLAKNVEDSQWIVKAKVRKLEYFRTKYPDRGHLVKEEGAWLLSSIYDMKSNALTSVGITGASTTDQMKDSAIELVYYEKRSEDYANGRMIVSANGVLLEDKDLPIGQYDIVKFDDMIIGGRYNSEAVITHMRPVQDQYNITRTRMAGWIRNLLAGKYMVAKGANLQQESINNSDSEVVEYVPVPNAAAPQAMNIPQIPPYAYKDLEVCDQELDYIVGINEISRGVLPSAGMPAAGMAFLQEQDQTRIGVMTSRAEVGFAKMGQCILKYVAKNYEIPRLLKTAGDDLEYTVQHFVGADIQDNFDVIVVPGSTLPSSKVLRRQDIMTSWQSGLLGNPQDPKVRMKVFKEVENGEVEDMWRAQALDDAQIKRMYESIEQGQMPDLNEFDNHNYILLEMNDYRKTDKFRALSPEGQKMFMYVMEWHITALNNLENPGLAQNMLTMQQGMQQLPQQHAQQMQTINQIHPGSPQNSGQAPGPQGAPQPMPGPQSPGGPK